MEYLYLTAFAVGIVAIIALLMNDIIAIQQRSRSKIQAYRDLLFRIITE